MVFLTFVPNFFVSNSRSKNSNIFKTSLSPEHFVSRAKLFEREPHGRTKLNREAREKKEKVYLVENNTDLLSVLLSLANISPFPVVTVEFGMLFEWQRGFLDYLARLTDETKKHTKSEQSSEHGTAANLKRNFTEIRSIDVCYTNILESSPSSVLSRKKCEFTGKRTKTRSNQISLKLRHQYPILEVEDQTFL